LENIFNSVTALIGTYVPNILGALLILIIGWIVASLVSLGLRELLKKTSLDNKLANKIAGEDELKPIEAEKWISKGVYWLIMIFVFVAFFEALKLTIITKPLNRLLEQIFGYAPQLLGAGLLFILAWLIATIIRKIIVSALKATNLDEKISQKSQIDSAKQIPLSKSLGDIVYWLVFLLFLPAILGALNLGGILEPVQSMINKILDFLPNIFTAGLILLVGWFVAKIVRQIVTSLLVALGTDKLSEKIGMNSVLGNQTLSGLIGLVLYVLILIPIIIAALNALALESLTQPASNMLNQILEAIPDIFAAALILVISYVVAKVLAGFIENLLSGFGFDNLFVKLGLIKELKNDTVTPSKLVGYIIIISVMLFAFTEAFAKLEFNQLVELTAQLTVLGGHILLGLVIMILGLFFGNLASDTVKGTGVKQANFYALVVKVAILVFAAAMGLRYMGLANEIINLAFGLLLGAIAVAVAIAFGIGGRDLAAKKLNDWNNSVSK